MNYQIISDGSCDLPTDIVNEKKLIVVPFYVSFDGTHYKKEMEEIGIRDFYDEMVANPKVFPKSSLPSAQDYVDVFEPLVQAGTPIICICISTKFSGSMQSALSAKDILLETYPEAKIAVIDATVNTVLQGQYVLEAVRMQEAGWSYEDVVNRLEKIKSTGRIFFTVGDLEYLKHGGRIGKLAGVAASALGIKPLITLKEGEIFSSGLARSRKKSLDKIIDMLLEYLKKTGKSIHTYSLALGFGYDKEEAEAFRQHVLSVINEKLRDCIPLSLENLPLRQIGATISVHTGPYAIGLGIIERAF
ncbi:MAG: DegV family protein [Lachnospiraceae bacterium]